jgi:hypothetical protein
VVKLLVILQNKNRNMEYRKLVGVTGLGGLFELINSKADGGIVRSLEDKSTKFVSNRLHSFSHLESIEVYTTGENVNLVDVFLAMQASDQSLPDAGKVDEIKKYYSVVYPTMDFERVYGSDLKKMIKWFDLIIKNNIEIKLSEGGAEGLAAEAVSEKTTAASSKSAPKAAAVKNAPAKKINTPRKMA